MNEIEKAFDDNFKNHMTKETVYKVICLLLLLSLMLIAISFNDTKISYSVYYLKQYLNSNRCICNALPSFNESLIQGSMNGG